MPLKSGSIRAIKVFLSYASEDRKLKDALTKHLSSMKQQGIIKDWHDSEIIAGSEFKAIISAYLNTSDIILLLISPDFIASDYCTSVEMIRAMERHETGEARVIPIILRPADWLGLPFARLNPLPTNGRAVTLWHNIDNAFLDITRGIRKVVDELAARIRGESSRKEVPIWNAPYRHNPFFTGREDILKDLHASLVTSKESSNPIQVLGGLAGIGKTQIAVEYAYRYKREYQTVLWVTADSREDLITNFISLADTLDIAEKRESDQKIVIAAVKRWLEAHSNWLLILDNVEDISMINDVIPLIFRGHVLITSRSQAAGPIAHVNAIEKMELDEAALFLLRRAKIIMPDDFQNATSPTNYARAKEISRITDGFPLALDQAGAYIDETKIGLEDYLGLYQTRRADLLKNRGKIIINHPASVTTTLSLSFEKVERDNVASIELLRLCAFLHPDAIPEEMFSEGASYLGQTLQPIVIDPLLYNEVIVELLKYSLVRRNPDNKTLAVHRVVQAVLKDAMSKEQQRQWMERAVLLVNHMLPQVKFETWPFYQRYLPQIQTCIDSINQQELWSRQGIRLHYLLGQYLRRRALLKEADTILEQAVVMSQKILGIEDLDTAKSLLELGKLYRLQNKYKEAEPLLEQALSIRQQILGPEHPDTAESLSSLAGLYRLQRKHREAEVLLVQALNICEQSLGPEDTDTAASLDNLALLYRIQGRYEEAEPLYQRAIDIYQQVLGSEHLDTAQSLDGLALLYNTTGRYAEAEPLYQQALTIKEQVLGSEHPGTAVSLNNLGFLYYSQGKYKEAEPLYLRALMIREQIFGPKHIEIAQSVNNLAILYADEGNYAKAETFYKRALSIREEVLGMEHPKTAQSLNNLAYHYCTQGKYEEAEPLYQRAIAIRDQKLGPKHPDTAQSISNLGHLYSVKGQHDIAEMLLEQALAIRQEVLVEGHPDTTITLNNLAELYFVQKRYTEAEPLYQQVLANRERFLGSEHPLVAESLNNLAKLYTAQKDYINAEPLYRRTLTIYQQKLGTKHPIVVNLVYEYADLLYAIHKDSEASELLEGVQTIHNTGDTSNVGPRDKV